MFYWILFLTILLGILGLENIRRRLQRLFPKITCRHFDTLLISLLFISVFLQHLQYQGDQKERWKRIAKIRYDGSSTGEVHFRSDYLFQLIRPTLKINNGIAEPICNESSYINWQKAIKTEPDFPFSYYYIALCDFEKNNPQWVNYAKRAKNILNKTKEFDEPYSNQKELLTKINNWLRTLQGQLSTQAFQVHEVFQVHAPN